MTQTYRPFEGICLVDTFELAETAQSGFSFMTAIKHRARRASKAKSDFRENLMEDFDEIYISDLGGNVRKNPKLSGTTHNVSGIQVGVSINIFVKKRIEN